MPDRALRVHLVAHHDRDVAAGASGATLSLGAALAAHGCMVSYFFHSDALLGGSDLSKMIRFPWRVNAHLARSAPQYDIVDATTGDAWVWLLRGRPNGSGTTVVTRSHGLEHVATEELRRRARLGETMLSWKYDLYHGGLRLWEVRRSLVDADAQVFLNQPDADFAVSRLDVNRDTVSVVPNGVPDWLLDLPRVSAECADRPIALAFIGSWIPRKGIRAIIEAADALVESSVSFSLLLLGTGLDANAVLSQFSAGARLFVRVVPRYAPADLPALLAAAEVLLHPSWTEGFSLALVEGMACGLAPVSTRAGGAASLLDGGAGILLEQDAGASLAAIVGRLSADRVALAQMRAGAQGAVQSLRWRAIAERTLAVYRSAMDRRASGRRAT